MSGSSVAPAGVRSRQLLGWLDTMGLMSKKKIKIKLSRKQRCENKAPLAPHNTQEWGQGAALGGCDQPGHPHRVLWSSCTIPCSYPSCTCPCPREGFGVFQIPEVRSTCVGGEPSRKGSSLEGRSDLANSIPIPQPKNLENVWLGTKRPIGSQGWAAATLCLSHAGFCCQWD